MKKTKHDKIVDDDLDELDVLFSEVMGDADHQVKRASREIEGLRPGTAPDRVDAFESAYQSSLGYQKRVNEGARRMSRIRAEISRLRKAAGQK